MTAGSTRRRSRRWQRPAWGKLAAIAAGLVVVAAAWRFTPLATMMTPQRILELVRAAGGVKWAPLFLALAYTPAAFVLFPRPVLSLLAIMAFGVWIGSACIAAGVLVAALATYGAGHLLPERAVRRLAGDRFERLARVLRCHGVLSIFAVNLLPTPPFVVQGIVAGAIRLGLRQYLLGIVLSLTPGLAAAMVFGREIVAALEDAARVNYWLVGATAAAFVLATFCAGRWIARRAAAYPATLFRQT